LIIDALKPSPIELKDANGNVLGIFGKEDYIQKVKDAGYDAVIINKRFGNPLDGWEIVSFNRSQIKTNLDNQITPQQKQQALQLYSQYLDTIGVTQIGYHHSESDIESFKTFKEGYFPNELKKKGTYYKEADDVVFFVKKPLQEEFMSQRPFVGAFGLKINNVLNFKTGEKIGDGVHPDIDKGIKQAVDNGNDAVDFGRIRDNKTWSEVIAITNPNNAIKLGTKQDIEGFKEFVGKEEVELSPEEMYQKSLDLSDKEIEERINKCRS
jgi:hypothetical protein